MCPTLPVKSNSYMLETHSEPSVGGVNYHVLKSDGFMYGLLGCEKRKLPTPKCRERETKLLSTLLCTKLNNVYGAFFSVEFV